MPPGKPNPVKDLKDRLAAALKSDATDFDVILALSHELAETDEENVRFSVDASHIDRLGRELVARQETAVAELVKNAYDADARSVTLVYESAREPGGTLKITDNGHGMTRAELIRGFMRLSTRDKVDNPLSRKYGREKAGRKGIGRFAAQRLGKILTLKTQTSKSTSALAVRIDWGKYEGHKEIFLITNEIEEIPRFKEGSGTLLEINGLRDRWSDEQIRRTYRYIADLLQPFPLSKRRKAPKGERPKDPGFKATFRRKDGINAETIADEQTTFFQHALAVIDAYVDETGRGYWAITSKKLDMKEEDRPVGPEKDMPTVPFEHLRDVDLRAYYFIEDEELPYPQNLKATIRSVLQEQGGIRLYRNGFRVPPYGSEGDDWLDLDKSTRRRQILPPHGNNNFLGFVELYDPDEADFQETSSREGLLNTQAFKELREFGYKALGAAVIAVGERRGRKTTTSVDRPRSPQENGEAIAKRLSNLAKREKNPVTKKVYENTAKQVLSMVVDIELKYQDQINEISMLRVLAGMGLSIGEFTHEARFLISSMGNGLDVLLSKNLSASKAKQTLKDLDTSFGTLEAYVSYFDRAVADNAKRFTKAEEIRDVVTAFEEAIQPWLKEKSIELEAEFDGYDLFATPMHPSEWSSILMNLCSNAVKAIGRNDVPGRLFIEGGEAGDSIYLEFSDNGDGVPEEIEGQIFNAFFTTTSPAGARDNPMTELVGTGLGLKIVKDIVMSYGGTIELVDPPDGYSTCFRIEIPRADEDEIDDA